MGRIEDLQTWLRRQAELPPIDVEARREMVWGALASLPDGALEAVHARWTERGHVERFASIAARLLRSGIGARWSLPRLEEHVDEALKTAITGRVLEGLIGLEIGRVTAIAEARWEAEQELADWAFAIGAVDPAGAVTPVGRVLVKLVGRDALQFVLELEVELSVGATDDLRASRALLDALVADEILLGGVIIPSHARPEFSFPVLRRLASLGLSLSDETYPSIRFRLAPGATDLVRAVLDPAPNPTRALVRALVESARTGVATEAGLTSTGPGVEYGRIVVHELRNALLPLTTSVGRVWSELERPEPDTAALGELRGRVDAAIARISDFARDSARLLTAVEPERFALRAVAEEAVGATVPDRNGRISVDLAELADAEIDGPRGRWVLLFVNLLRNAAQARASAGRVEIHSQWDRAGRLHLYVDDDGPGVAEELRERIFEEGVSTRGGSGLGLAEARRTVQLASGTLICEVAPAGGARFHLHLPARRRA